MPLALFLNYKHFQNVPKHRKYNECPCTSHCIKSCQLFALLSSISDLPTHSLDHLTDNKHFGLHLSNISVQMTTMIMYLNIVCPRMWAFWEQTIHYHFANCLLGKSRCSVIFFFYCMNNEITLRVLLDYGLMLSASFQQEDANKLPLLSTV